MKLLETYRTEFSRAACRPESQTLHCIAYLDQDVGAAIPFLNAVLGGYTYIKEPPSVTVRSQGKLITVHADRIAINAIREPAEAEKILQWLQREINAAWDNRASIEPSFEAAPRPQVIEILRHLPKTNCQQCGQPACTVFAVQVSKGGRGVADCPALLPEAAQRLTCYLRDFKFD